MENQEQVDLSIDLILLYSKQTAEEKEQMRSLLRNREGFNRWDAHILTRIVNAAKRNGGLTERQQACVTKKLAKYHRQIGNLRTQAQQTQLFGGN